VRCLKRTVPAALPGIVFLSGGQSDEAATAHLNEMARMPGLPGRSPSPTAVRCRTARSRPGAARRVASLPRSERFITGRA